MTGQNSIETFAENLRQDVLALGGVVKITWSR